MSPPVNPRDLVIAINACGDVEPSPRIAAAARRAGGLGVLDLGSGDSRALRALEQAASWSTGPIGVRVPADCAATPADVERAGRGRIDLVVIGDVPAPWSVSDLVTRYRVLAEVTSLDEAYQAAAAGVHGLIARGSEGGGRVSDLSSFVLLQQLVSDPSLVLPVWVAGGIGPRTAVACVVGGAAGVVLDSQLALMPESDLPDDVAASIRRMDGSETVLVDGFRGIRRGGPHDTASELLPVGQDGWLAALFARRWTDTAAALRGLRAGILAAASADTTAHPLAPGGPLAERLGVRVPIAQGPMTRVSDEAGFADAVAADGGLPFIALALAGPEQSRRMLQETAALLGDRPWGVGVLGFAPEEIRNAQLEVIREIRPKYAIIAGGRASQVKAMERDGTAAFLHVPSPGLLRQFLNSGVRRFIFEGAECGGHVGPRASFPLWEAQLAVLEEFLDDQPAEAAAEVQVFFAGGIHDARSAAMVTAMATPLTSRGAGIGVLMGTAYLFTAEAVRHGAIQPRFQQVAVEATGTALLETAPGHATRCLHSPFVDDFHSLRTELEAAGVEGRQVWEQLEMLNVGRLRIASKGKRREGATLVEVDEETQANEGMYMAGQVAVLRDATTTIADLHDEVTTGSDRYHADRVGHLRASWTPAAESGEPVKPLDIAIVGMACILPNSPDLASFWQTVLGGADAVTEVPPDRWDLDTYYAPEVGPGQAGRISVSKWGGFIDRVPFDAIRYGIPPAALASIDPTQLLALEVSHRAMVDAGYAYDAPGADHSRTGVVFGAEAGSDMGHAQTLRTMLPAYLGDVPPELEDQLPTVTEDSFPGVLANVIAGRVANRLNLGGPNFTVDAACASSLAAMDAACKELATGDSDLMVCGGADLHNGINDYLMFTSAHALSPTGRSRPFDSTGDGIALGEGVACVVLKRLADAERDGDRIYAVIKGLGGSSDGRALGLTAPRTEGQRRALDRAYASSGISPRQIGLVEAHGTGTVVGDRTELETLTKLFTEEGAEPGSCALGSVKSQIGHTKCAAGLAGVIKAALALRTGVKPPTLHLTRPNPAWSPTESPFAFFTEARPWTAPAAERLAGVSAFGFGGTNFHVVLSAYADAPEPRHSRDKWPAELFCFRGADRAGAYRAVRDLATKLDTRDSLGRPWRLRDLAADLARRAGGRADQVQVAVVARDLDELAELLRRALAGEHDPRRGLIQPSQAPLGGKVAFLFPGQGSQRPGALAELFVAFPELRHYLELGGEWAELLFPPAAFDPETEQAQSDRVRDTRVAQPVLGIGGLAVDHVLRRLNIRPDLAGGHSYGELVALSTAGAFDARTLLELSRERAASILGAAGDDPGTMAAVAGTVTQVGEVLTGAGLTDRVVVANHNGPEQVVISGPTDAVRDAVGACKTAGLKARPLQVACAFHSPVVAGGSQRFAEVLAAHPIGTPRLPVFANRTAARYPDSPDQVREELAAQIGAPVRFVEQIESMYAAGARCFVEAGPGQVLTRLVGAVLGDRPHVAVAVDGRPGGELRGFLLAVAELACAGVPVQTGWLFHGRDIAEIVPAPAQQRPIWTVDGQLVRDPHGNPLPGGMTPPRRIKEFSMTTSYETTNGGRDGRDALLSEFLRTSRDMIATQRDVMLAYFGLAPAERPAAWQPVDSPTAAVAYQPVQGYPPAVTAAPAPGGNGNGNGHGVLDPVYGGAPAGYAPPVATPVSPAPAGMPLETLMPAASAVAVAPVGAAPVSAGVGVAEFQGAILSVLSERTGYPVELIELDLDLEADLSIDSIKRAEVAGEVAARLKLSVDGDESELEDLVKARTVRTMVSWLTTRMGGANGAAPAAPAPVASAVAVAPVGAAPVSTGVGVAEFQGAILSVLSERTGYPVELIELDLDLEADLSIDSIKRAEVAGEVAARLKLSVDGDESELEDLVKARTVRTMVSWLTTRMNGESGAAETAAVGELSDPSASDEGGEEQIGSAPQRLVAQPVPISGESLEPASLASADFVITGGSPVTAYLAELLSEIGASGQNGTLRELGAAPESGSDGLIILDGLTGDGGLLLPDAFPAVKKALLGGARWLIAAVDPAGPAVPGLAGLFRTVSREYPDVTARLIEVDPELPGPDLAQQIFEELLIPGAVPVVNLRGDDRQAYNLTAVDLGPLAAGGAGPAGDGVSEVQAVGLDQESVVVLFGGARGITPWFARALASASRCRLELVGRTPLPEGPVAPELAAAPDGPALRAALARQGMRNPAEIERTVRAILAGREVEATLAELRELGAEARYHAVDVCDTDGVRRLLKEIHTEFRRIDGVVFAAGVIEDKLIAEKDPASFARVFDTKVNGANTILGALAESGAAPKFVVLFGSIAAAYGNRGQADYAAANDALDVLGGRWASDTGNRCLTVHWGPWAPGPGHGGMVSPELVREYARRGIALIDPEEGALSLLRELAWGDPTVTSVVYTSSGW